MNRLNRKMEYALMALKHIHDKPAEHLTSTKEVCEVNGSPFDATARVMQIMANKGLLKSEQGVRGGYYIAKELSSVSMFDLIEMIQGPMAIAKCIDGSSRCELSKSCNIQKPLDVLNQKIRSFYYEMSLNEVLRPNVTRNVDKVKDEPERSY